MIHLKHSSARKVGQRLIRVVVADANPLTRAKLIDTLEQNEIAVLDSIEHGRHILQSMQTLQPDILILDLKLPGLEDITHIIRSLHFLQVIITSTVADPTHILTLLDVGVAGYMLKDETPLMLLLAVQAVARGEVWVSSSVATGAIRRQACKIAALEQYKLSNRECEVLTLLAQAKTNKEISDALGTTERTVRFHLRNIYDKLGLAGRSQAIVWALQNGLGNQ